MNGNNGGYVHYFFLKALSAPCAICFMFFGKVSIKSKKAVQGGGNRKQNNDGCKHIIRRTINWKMPS